MIFYHFSTGERFLTGRSVFALSTVPMSQIQVPAGSQDGRTIRLKGMGIRHERGEGDLVCHLQLTVPAILDSASRKLADKLLRSLGLE